MRDQPFRENADEIADLLKQYEDLRAGKKASFLEEESFEIIIESITGTLAAVSAPRKLSFTKKESGALITVEGFGSVSVARLCTVSRLGFINESFIVFLIVSGTVVSELYVIGSK